MSSHGDQANTVKRPSSVFCSIRALSSLASVRMQSGPEFTLRYNLFRSAQINGAAAPGYSSGQANQALEEVFAQSMPPEMGYDYLGMSFQENKAQKGVQPVAVFSLSLRTNF